jgi:hypothetical protein
MRRNALINLSLVSSLLLSAVLALADSQPVLKLTAFAASLERGKTGLINIDINRWSTDEEREALLTTLQEFGQDKLLDTLQKVRPPVGRISMPGRLGWDLYYARNLPNPDGSRRIVVATNRAVAFGEAATNTRSMQYQFTLAEIHLDAEGNGEGKLVTAARLSWDKASKKLEIENYGALPVDLINVSTKK